MKYRYGFDDKKKSNKKRIIFLIVFIMLAIMISSMFFRNNSNKFISTVSGVLSYPIVTIKNAFSWVGESIGNIFIDKNKVIEENKKLEEENDNLRLQVLENKRILEENESLKNMLDIKNSYKHFNLKVGNVIYREHDNWTKTFKIDVGSDDGIKLNQAVVHKEGLVGYISNVSNTSSTVTTILDPSSAVSVNISTINEPAMLQGDLSLKAKNELKLDYIELDAEVSIGDMLYTSGLGSIYPNSIPVAKIIEVVSKKNDINRYAIAEPCVDIKSISEVAVIIN